MFHKNFCFSSSPCVKALLCLMGLLLFPTFINPNLIFLHWESNWRMWFIFLLHARCVRTVYSISRSYYLFKASRCSATISWRASRCRLKKHSSAWSVSTNSRTTSCSACCPNAAMPSIRTASIRGSSRTQRALSAESFWCPFWNWSLSTYSCEVFSRSRDVRLPALYDWSLKLLRGQSDGALKTAWKAWEPENRGAPSYIESICHLLLMLQNWYSFCVGDWMKTDAWRPRL